MDELHSTQLPAMTYYFSLINQSMTMYIAPLQDRYSEALSTQAKRKRTVFKSWWNWEDAPFGRCIRSEGSLFQVAAPTTEKEGSALSQSGEWDHQIAVDKGPQCMVPAQEERGRQSSCK